MPIKYSIALFSITTSLYSFEAEATFKDQQSIHTISKRLSQIKDDRHDPQCRERVLRECRDWVQNPPAAITLEQKNDLWRSYFKVVARMGIFRQEFPAVPDFIATKQADPYTMLVYAERTNGCNVRTQEAVEMLKQLANLCDGGYFHFVPARAHINLGNAREGDRIAHYQAALKHTNNPDLRAQAYIGLGNARDGKDGGGGSLSRSLKAYK